MSLPLPYFEELSNPNAEGWVTVTFKAPAERFWIMLGAEKLSATERTTAYIDDISLRVGWIVDKKCPLSGSIYAIKSRYRWGFNGMERDDEVKGIGNSLNFGARIYDSRTGRWLSTDPLQANYPDLSTYSYAANNPVFFIDPDGKQVTYHTNKDNTGRTVINVKVSAVLINESSKSMSSPDLALLKSSIESKAKSTFSGTHTNDVYNAKGYKTGTETVRVNFTLDVKIINSVDDIGANDHVIGIVNTIPEQGHKMPDGRLVDPIGLASRDGNIQTVESKTHLTDLTHTITHEMGHWFGLKDEYLKIDGIKDNLMFNSDSYKLTNEQRQIMFNMFKEATGGKPVSYKNFKREVLGKGNSRSEYKEFKDSNKIKTKK